jgi:two-component sensor histidine kinase/CheY-like chemotaxis protein
MIDDSAADRKLCRLLLKEVHGADLEFVEASTAERGLETLRAVRPDCVLLDYRLPDMSGLEFLARLQGEIDPGLTAVVMLTGMASEQIAVEAMKTGAQDYLVKDRITAEALALAIQKATEKVGLMQAIQDERDRLARSLAEKEVLIKEVHHRVKNNLQVIASLLRMQAENVPNPNAADALREGQQRVESMALIHEQLYDSGDLRRVDFAKHVGLLLNNLFHSFGADPTRIRASVEMGECLLLGVDQAIPAGLILNELISNAFKYAFPAGRRGSIVVEGGRMGDSVRLVIRDDGVGLPADFSLESTKSLGLRIVRILTRQLKGVLDIEHAEGALFRICFPLEVSVGQP